ncbi:hypothetical protein K466DRAFT_476581 [Polyporus arcularius HHB13444]|uniref:RRM domain-containing protein n=1 Tax=Polyporus arcularius HHB13444 TaxID=1314778 RepID=A0A5C3PXY8_9APHY|nr:hypothetical protein K466DRAFT_476581 [Polyporus arcularius HHB13444]
MSRNRTRTRSSSRTYKWIEEQQQHLPAVEDIHLDDTVTPVAAPVGLPYLAYPKASAASLVNPNPEGIARADSYVFVDADVSQPQPPERVPPGWDAHSSARSETPSTPRKSRNTQGIFNAPSPLRSLQLAFSSRRPSVPASGARAHSPASSNSTSTFRRNTERAASHSRGSSLSTVSAIQRTSRPPDLPQLAATPPKPNSAWKFRRPAIGSHFAPSLPDDDSESSSPPPRPSTSSSITHSGSSTVYTRTSSDAPRKMYFGSIRSHSSTTIFSSTPSLWSLPADASHMYDPPESTKVIARDRVMSSSEGAPMTWRPSTPAHMGSVSNLLTSPKARKKRKLIISGIPPDDERRFDGVKKWCESFGELNCITRVPNGDLHIDFRRVEVADTVCRLNARVHIAGVGSVCLSWFTGKRP